MKLFALGLAASAAFLAGSAQAAIIWYGPNVTFTKADNADWTLPENQDRITDNVWITRKNSQQIYNIKIEAAAGGYGSDSPKDTEWAWPGKDGNPSDPAAFTATNYANLHFGHFDHIYNIPDVTIRPAVVHLITDDIYLEVQFTSWTQGAGGGTPAGGGFSYDRSTAPPALITSFGLPGNPAIIEDNPGTKIDLTVPYGTAVTSLAPTYTLTSGACDHASGTAYDFTSPVTYTVIDGLTTNVYTVTVTVAPNETTLIWKGGDGAWDFSTPNWTGQTSGSTLPFYNGLNVLFTNPVGGMITISPNVRPLSTTVSAGNYTFSGGPIATGSLTKNGAGTLTLAGANTYSGDTAVNGGTLVANGSSALGRTTNFTVAGGATLLLSGGGAWPASAATVTGAGTVSMHLGDGINVGLNFDMSALTGVLDLTNGMVAVNPVYSPYFVSPTNGTIRVEDNTTVYLGWTGYSLNTTVELYGGTDNGEGYGVLRGDTATLDGVVILKTNSTFGCAGGTFTINAVISDGGHGYGFTTVKSGTFVLTATNTYSGPTIVSDGTLVLAGANTGSGPMIVTNGTLVCSNVNSLGSGALIINNPGVVNLNYTGDHVVSSLFFDGTAQAPGTYGSLSSTAPLLNQNDIWFVGTGTGTVTVVPEPVNIRVLSGQPNIDVLGTAVGSTYTLVYKNNLTDVSWTALSAPSGSQAGVNGTLTLSDTTATGRSQRFYKIQASTP